MMKVVLILEDDRGVLDLLCLVLASKGYVVMAASTAEEAFQHASRCNPVIDLLIADMVLTASTGIRVGLQLKQRMPQLKILLVSGYPQDIWRDSDFADLNELASDTVAILQKPFLPEVLVKRVGELIGA